MRENFSGAGEIQNCTDTTDNKNLFSIYVSSFIKFLFPMSRVKDKNGLTYQQEQFCQYVVDAYGNDTRGILVAAYRKAYNCKSDAKVETHWSSASRLMSDPKVTARIEQLRQEQSRLATISRERIISDDVSIIDLDPLDLWTIDEKTGRWRMRFINEIPKKTRKLLKFVRVGKNLVPEVDKDAAKKRLIEVLGFAAAKDVNLNAMNSMIGELRIGFDDDDEEQM